MNSALLKRLFRSISSGSDDDIRKVARVIIDEESKKGHTTLSKELDTILSSASNAPAHAPSSRVVPMMGAGLTEFPKSKRSQTPLAMHIPFEKLKHHMVLAPDTEARFQRIEKEFAARERLAKFGFQPRRKILLYGPPGCGKTMGAERLAWNTGLPLIKVRFDAVVSSYLGETAANLRSIFDSAQQTPCVLFVDEADSLARSRRSDQELGEIKRVVNSFLQLLDEFDSPGLFVAATNLDDQLDEAIWRRFDEIVQVLKPGKLEIRELILQSLSAIKSELRDWDSLLQASEGFSAAQVVRACQDAAKNTILQGGEIVSQQALLDSMADLAQSGRS